MNAELDWMENNKNRELTPRPTTKNVKCTKWVFKNKMNGQGKIIRNKARLVCKDYLQVEGLDYEETFTLVVRLEKIEMFLAFLCYKYFKVYQMHLSMLF